MLLHHYPPVILQQQTQSQMLSGPYRICGSSADSHSIENRIHGRSLARILHKIQSLWPPIIRPDQRLHVFALSSVAENRLCIPETLSTFFVQLSAKNLISSKSIARHVVASSPPRPPTQPLSQSRIPSPCLHGHYDSSSVCQTVS